ncbi:hypothetical protein [Nocardiopsis potens]|uniref:hypothetical protein n=1 Tax=Nocardiopsis potens TaxID=1246458 RepID=UPI00034571C2|nr:hypothetical protein [Nocardiopsis potens]
MSTPGSEQSGSDGDGSGGPPGGRFRARWASWTDLFSWVVWSGGMLCLGGALLLVVQFTARLGDLGTPTSRVWIPLVGGIAVLVVLGGRVVHRTGRPREAPAAAPRVRPAERSAIRAAALLVASSAGWAAIRVIPGGPLRSVLPEFTRGWPWYTHALWIACLMLLVGGVLLAFAGEGDRSGRTDRTDRPRAPGGRWMAYAFAGLIFLTVAGAGATVYA